VSLVGPDGLLAGVTRTVLQTALDTGHLEPASVFHWGRRHAGLIFG
jgi:hypothetical protein